MKQEENERYEQWLQQVRKTQPILTRPDDLARDILQKVARTPRKRKERRKFMTWASAIAAGFLLCFTVYATFFYSVSFHADTRNAPLNVSSLPSCLPEWSASCPAEMTIKEKGARLSEMWRARKAKQHEQKRLIHQLVSNNH